MQPIVSGGQIEHLAMNNRSQSVILPQSHHQFYVPLIDSLGVSNHNLAGSSLDQILQQDFERVHPDHQQPSHGAALGVKSVRRSNHMDPFFDESPQELSSIEHSAFNPAQ